MCMSSISVTRFKNAHQHHRTETQLELFRQFRRPRSLINMFAETKQVQKEEWTMQMTGKSAGSPPPPPPLGRIYDCRVGESV